MIYRRIVTSVLMVVSVFLYGTLGHFFLLEGKYTLAECAYRTIVMLATINEAFSISEVGGIFRETSYLAFELTLVVFGIAVILYSLSTITAFFVEGELQQLLRLRKMSKEIAKYHDHYIICGGGETGQVVAGELTESRRKLVIIEKDPDRVERLTHLGYRYVEGDASEDEVLERAGIARAKGLVAALPSDKDNLFVTITARQMNPNLRIIAKGVDHHSDAKIMRAGANTVVRPAAIGGMRIASELIRPTAVSFMDKMVRDPEDATRIEEIHIYEGSPLAGETIVSSQFRQRTGLQVVALRKPGEESFCYRPQASAELTPGTTLIVIGLAADLEKAWEVAGMK